MRKKTPYDEEAKSLSNALRLLMRLLTMGQDDPVTELPLAQLKVCSALSNGPLSMSSVGRELGVSLSAMTQLADRLERARLVQRVNQGADRRVRLLQLTARGEKMMRLHDEVRVRRLSNVLERLTPKKRNEIASAIQTLTKAAASTNENTSNGNPQHSNSKVFI